MKQKITGESLHKMFLILKSRGSESAVIKFVDGLYGWQKAILGKYWANHGCEEYRQTYFRGA